MRARGGGQVTAVPAARRSPDAPRPRRQRGSLTRQIIVSESLRLLDADGASGFSLPKLGRALGADQTAVYRHFASKDDLVLAIADSLIEEAMAGLEPHDCWIDTLSEMTRRLRDTYLAHPAAASMSAYRTTQGPAEMRAVDIIIGAILAAGFEGSAAAVMYRAIGDFALAWAGSEAAFLALDAQAQASDRAAWTRAYLSVDRAQHPSIWQVRSELPEVRDEDIFETILAMVMAGLRLQAPRACDCHALARQAPAGSS